MKTRGEQFRRMLEANHSRWKAGERMVIAPEPKPRKDSGNGHAKKTAQQGGVIADLSNGSNNGNGVVDQQDEFARGARALQATQLRRLILENTSPWLAREEVITGVLERIDVLATEFPTVERVVITHSASDRLFVNAVVNNSRFDLVSFREKVSSKSVRGLVEVGFVKKHVGGETDQEATMRIFGDKVRGYLGSFPVRPNGAPAPVMIQ